ncbi:hypothetical protein F5Y10DRAFT_271793 [Nemania abortiva]|nr:hypothetical protein F5Y10DRAFT_271793 [Nemania abortiva]
MTWKWFARLRESCGRNRKTKLFSCRKKKAEARQIQHGLDEHEEHGKTGAPANGNENPSTTDDHLVSTQDYDNLLEEHSRSQRENERLQGEVSRLSGDNRNLESDNHNLKETIHMRDSQILILRPYRTGFTQENAKNGFEDLLQNIELWVEKWTDKLIDNEGFRNEWINSLHHFPRAVHKFQQLLSCNQDLLSTIGYVDSDQDIMSACILRFVRQKIFGDMPCGIVSRRVELLQEVESTLPLCTAPKLDMSAISSWRAQAYHALFSRPEYSEAREKAIDAVTSELANILGFLCGSSKWSGFISSISSEIIEPSVRLDENFRRTNEEYYFETAPWGEPGEEMGRSFPDGQLRELLGSLECFNAVKHNRKFLTDQLNPIPSAEEIRNRLHFISSLHPALKVRELRGKNKKGSVTLVKEKVLVAWDPKLPRGKSPATLKEETWLSRFSSN